MAFFLRKALKFGPVRLNLSKSGVGMSVGVTGARVGIRSSDGQPYVYGGRYGLYYRQNLGSRGNAQIDRAAEVIASLLQETQEEWLPAIRTATDRNADASAKQEAGEQFQRCGTMISARLKELGFPVGVDSDFSQAVSEIHTDFVLQIAFPEMYEEWSDTCDELLGRAAKRAEQIVRKHRDETLTKLMGRRPLLEVVKELADEITLPQLRSEGLVLEDNPVYEMRLASVVSRAIFDDLDQSIPK